jgi:endonuclease IV
VVRRPLLLHHAPLPPHFRHVHHHLGADQVPVQSAMSSAPFHHTMSSDKQTASRSATSSCKRQNITVHYISLANSSTTKVESSMMFMMLQLKVISLLLKSLNLQVKY